MMSSIFGPFPFGSSPSAPSGGGGGGGGVGGTPNTTVFSDRIVLEPTVGANQATSLAFYTGSTTNQADTTGDSDFQPADSGIPFDFPRDSLVSSTGSGFANVKISSTPPAPPSEGILGEYYFGLEGVNRRVNGDNLLGPIETSDIDVYRPFSQTQTMSSPNVITNGQRFNLSFTGSPDEHAAVVDNPVVSQAEGTLMVRFGLLFNTLASEGDTRSVAVISGMGGKVYHWREDDSNLVLLDGSTF
jgi:hypothetical protein